MAELITKSLKFLTYGKYFTKDYLLNKSKLLEIIDADFVKIWKFLKLKIMIFGICN